MYDWPILDAEGFRRNACIPRADRLIEPMPELWQPLCERLDDRGRHPTSWCLFLF